DDYGGCMYVNDGMSILVDSVVSNCRTIDDGGGILVTGYLGAVRSRIKNNVAGDEGGGLYNYYGIVTLKDSTIANNIGGTYAGGLLTYVGYSRVSQSDIISNSVTSLSSSYAGGSLLEYGLQIIEDQSTIAYNSSAIDCGGLYSDYGGTLIDNSTISHNRAAEDGGGICDRSDGIWLRHSLVEHNVAGRHGGGFHNIARIEDSTIRYNQAGNRGGGIYAFFVAAIVENSSIYGNSAGYGGGIVADEPIVLNHVTVSENSAITSTGGISMTSNANLRLMNSIVANSTGADCSQAGELLDGGYNLIESGNCVQASSSIAADPLLVPMANLASGEHVLKLKPGSPAVDLIPLNANGCGDKFTADQRGVSRPLDGNQDGTASCDAGAFEGQLTIYVSSTTAGTVNGVTFTDEDILAFNTATGNWLRFFDGSDVGLGRSAFRDLDAFTILDDGSILLSISGASTIPDVGTIDDSDIVRFIPTKTGPKTIGSYQMYFDGSDVGLDTDKEDIDALDVLADGRIIISTLGTAQTTKQFGNTLNSLDEDLIVFTPTSTGENTAGFFSLYADGSDFGLDTPQEDMWGVSEAGSDLYINPAGIFDTGIINGTPADFFACNRAIIGSVASCDSELLFFNGTSSGIGGETLDGIYVGFN
ncbi:MAG: choice-of-anchor Q domain-containing protein, partial [Chloroflexota bacterium]